MATNVEQEEKLPDLGRAVGTRIHFTAGLDFDIERIIYKVFDEFETKQEPRFSFFVNIWHQNKFGLIFSGRRHFRELYELTVEIFHRVKQYAFSKLNRKKNNILVRYAAIYLLYSLFLKQPCRPLVKIRLTSDEFRDIEELMEEARADAHHDVLYAWAKLVTVRAFHFTVTDKLMGVDVAHKIESSNLSKPLMNVGYFKTSEFKAMMKNVSKAHTKYMDMKQTLYGGEPGYGLQLCDQDFPSKITELVRTGEDLPSTKKRTRNSSGIGNRRKALKDRFFAAQGELSYREKKIVVSKNNLSSEFSNTFSEDIDSSLGE